MVSLTFKLTPTLLLLAFSTLTSSLPSPSPFLAHRTTDTCPPTPFVHQTTCNSKTYTFESLSGFGFVPSDFRDKFGDTISLGSSIALERKTWLKKSRKVVTGPGTCDYETYYTGILWMLPDRGWNTQGTSAWQPRVHKFSIDFVPLAADAPTPAPVNLKFKYQDTVLLTDPSGAPISGLDPTTVLNFGADWPVVPAAQFTGDGFGGAGTGGTRVSLDPEGLVLDTIGDGGFWISDEYGPYVYKFDKTGKMNLAVRPPAAYIPKRNGVDDFSANSPPIYDPGHVTSPKNPDNGRANNQGFEGLTVSGDGRNLYVMLQSATIQDGGLDKTTNQNSRLLKYDISDGKARFAREYTVPLPMYNDPTKTKNPRTAGQSEIHALGSDQFFVLSRDSFGRGTDLTKSVYRQIDVFDISGATDLKPLSLNSITTSPTSGLLLSSITPALYCPFLNINTDSELARFGLRNGGADDKNCLNEKWESLAIMPVDGEDGDDDEWFVLAISDNDFITQNGFVKGGQLPYHDDSGLNLDSQALMFKIRLPVHSRPFPRVRGD